MEKEIIGVQLTPVVVRDPVFIFVYSKDSKIVVLGFEDSKKQHDNLLSKGFKHTQTLDACAWIEYLNNICNSFQLLKQIKSLQ